MRVVVPFDATDPKTRLAPVLSEAERSDFAAAMLGDVVSAVRGAGHDPVVLATEPLGERVVDAPVTVDDRPLSVAVNDALSGAAASTPVAVVMADLALATPATIERLCSGAGDVAMVPGRGAGTNALVVSHPDFRVDYHGTSYLDHLRRARDIGASVREVDSARLSTDVDEPADLTEVLVLAEGDAPGWLRDAGFRLAVTDGRVEVVREG